MQEETLQNQISEYEKPLQNLIGKSIMDVFYYEINYGKPTWNQGKFHSLDYGIELQMSDDTSCYFIWGSTYCQYDLKCGIGSITNEFIEDACTATYNANDNKYWQKRISKKIKNIRSYWSYWRALGNNKRTYYPQDIEITFENNTKLWISASEVYNGKAHNSTDHLTVVFDDSTRAKFQIGIL